MINCTITATNLCNNIVYKQHARSIAAAKKHVDKEIHKNNLYYNVRRNDTNELIYHMSIFLYNQLIKMQSQK